MTGSAFRAAAPVSAVCAAFRTQPSAYPPSTRKPDVAPTCGSVRQSYSTEAGAPAGGFRRRKEPQAAKQDKAAGSCAPPQRSQLPAVRAVSGIYEGVPNTAKNSWRALRNEKSLPFQGKQRGSNEKHEVNTEKW